MSFVSRAVTTGFAPLLLVGTVFGQLSPEDIAALRQKGEAEGWTFTVGENEATGRPMHELCGSVEPPDWRSGGRFDPGLGRANLPESFDWRDHNGCTPIRNQGGCGSCWAFAAVGVVESAIIRNEGISADLSEQWLVSCTAAGSCSGGWHTDALTYMQRWGAADDCGDFGAVMEADFPYVQSDAECGCPYPHPYLIDSWAYVQQGAMPTPAQIKQTIYDHGPVAVTVYANSPMQAYNGGVFNACENQPANHAVVLVGWDDNLGDWGAWIMRNSWGEWWGDDGYMQIEFGCSGIGAVATYVDYPHDCNNNGAYDHCDLDCDAGNCISPCGQSADCNVNNIPDECEPDADCNGNGVQDICDIYDGIAEDCDSNSVPDQCDPDCNDNGIPDACEMVVDCNGNGVQDICDIAAGTSADCNGNQWLDECELAGISAQSGVLSPIGRFSPQQYTIPGAPGAVGDVTFYFTAIADLNLTLKEWVDVEINGIWVGRVFQTFAYDCPTVPNFDGFVLSAETFNTAVAGGDAVIDMLPTDAMDAAQCVPFTFVTVSVDYETAEDCTGNGIPDVCEPDCNENGVADSCDILDGTCVDADDDIVPDECDNCDLYNPDQVDCQPNAVGDVCDLASGQSEDINSDGIPDECVSPASPPAPEPGGPPCGVAGDCADAYLGADCVAGLCYVPKNRYLSIDPTATDFAVAYQVEVIEAADYPTAVGRTWWLDEPVCYEYPTGDPVLPTPSTCEGADRFAWVSKLTDTPVTRVWPESPLHITDCGIVSAVTYEIRASADGGVFLSEPLMLGTAHNPEGEAQSWGDITGGPVAGRPGCWLPPERSTNMGDVGNAIRTFENRSDSTGCPPRVWLDIEVNQVINLGDIQFIITAFEGTAYADLEDLEFVGVHPADCP